MSDKKYYWLKLKRDFFDRHDIRIIKAMPDGAEIVLFYLKLMLESIDHEGTLRFNEKRPYTREDLAVITDTDIDIVNRAIDLFFEMDLLECDEQKTLILPKVMGMIGSAADNDNAKRQQRFRDKQKELNNDSALRNCYACVTNSNESIEIEKEIDIDNIYIAQKSADFERQNDKKEHDLTKNETSKRSRT